ncbi:hypothetical protein RclHR1_10190007 [Rhizophagus clarus]|uniref:F-box domain-containing protein n=1 Tax=Rhizophagus clarus TaxID=94130 RepID=A0A2Z6QRT9_9GLOM|nr:hypothetical protein RclHR1_10190007 [Rhizophagus clarus]GES98914.1 hypothetical protein GLOIN_2v1485119 [Rhizophagus clarus]
MSQLIEDCLRIIFTEFKDYSGSLYSCMLVNRYWCQIVVPILWRNPYIYKKISHKKLYYTIFNLLPTDSKQFLSNNNIKLPLNRFSNKPLFNYISFSSQISLEFIDDMIRTLVKKEFECDKYKILEHEIYKLFINNCKYIKDFYWKTTQPLFKYLGALNCFSQLYALTIDLQFVNSTALFEMAKICQNIEDLKVWYCNGDIPGLIMLIEVQKNLQSLFIYFMEVEKPCVQLSEVIERKANTIKKFTMEPFIATLSPKFFPLLINLQHLDLRNVIKMKKEIVGMQEWKNYLSISSFPNLHCLKTIYLPIRFNCMLIEKSHGNIVEINVSRHSYNRTPLHSEKLMEAISKHCPRLEKLTIDVELKNLSGIKDILLNCSQLKKIRLSLCNEGRLNVCDELLEILVKFSPNNLNTFSLNKWKFSVESLQSFFESWRNRFPIIFDLYFGNFTEEHKVIVKKYFDEGIIKETNFL